MTGQELLAQLGAPDGEEIEVLRQGDSLPT
jgi:hypothetical protein